MSLHYPVNKPRSIHRQLPTYSSPIPPNLEQSLDEWLNHTGSNNSLSSDVSNYSHYLTQSSISTSPTTYTTYSEQQQQQQQQEQEQHIYPCPCCELPQCTSWKRIIKVTRKLETETRLAAEVGQSLLQTNEAYKVELDKLKQQVKQYQEQKHVVELSLDDAERLNRQLEHEKDKWMWKYEKSQKILDEAAADLETANIKCATLTRDIEHSKIEMDKLQHLKIKSYQYGTRQEILESKLQDMKQELVISRKDKLALESKYKKLTTQYETLTCTYQDIYKEAPKKRLSEGSAKPLSSITPPTATDIDHASTDEIVAFVKELVSTNNELKSELLATSTQLNDLQNELNSPDDKSSQYNNSDNKNESQNSIGTTRNNGILLKKHINNVSKKISTPNRPGQRPTTSDGRLTTRQKEKATAPATVNTKTRHRSASVRVSKSKSTRESHRSSSLNKGTVISPRTTTSSPVVHHHYHYYADGRQQNINNKTKTMDIDDPVLVENMENSFSALDYGKPRAIGGERKPTEATITHPECKTTTIATETPAKNNIDSISQSTDQLTDSIGTRSPRERILLDICNLPSTSLEPILSSTPSMKSPTLLLSPSNEVNNTSHSITKDFATTTTTTTTTTAIVSPSTTLVNQAQIILHRIRATDPRTINRRLQRAFDIGELSNMSNSLLQNIISDVDTMYARFFWQTPDEIDDDYDDYTGGGADKTNKTNEFLPMVQLFQELLREIGQLSITINHLQVAYVKKVKENEIKADSNLHGPTSSTSSSLSAVAVIDSNDSTTTPPSLLPSGNTSCTSTSSKSLASSTVHNSNTMSSLHWFSPSFVGNNDTTSSHNSGATRTGDQDSSHTSGRQLNKNSPQQPKSTTKNLHHLRQQHRSPGLDYNKNMIWPTLSSMMDAWNQRPPMENSSSFLDREWHWSCSDVAH